LELLSAAKINPDGYNIILQGDITRLVEMSSVERRQIIEEIAGIGFYEEKKERALKELQKVEDKLNEAEIVLKERESYLKDLKKDRNQALKYKELSDKVKVFRASFVKLRLDKKQASFDSLEKKSDGHKERLSRLNDRIQKLKGVVQSFKDEIKRINDEIEQKAEVEQIGLQKEIEDIKVDLATHKTRISVCNSEINKIAKRRDLLKSSFEEIVVKIKDLKEKRAGLLAQFESLNESVSNLESTIKKFKEKHNLSDESEIDAQFEAIDKKVEEKQLELQSLREKQQELVREKDKLEFQLMTIDEKIAKVEELESANKKELKRLKKSKDEFKKVALELNDLLNKDSSDAASLADLRNSLQKKREELQKLELKKRSVEEKVSLNIGVKKVLENKSLFGDVYGTIAELGSVDAKFSLALEVAAASKLNSVVVDNEKTAAKAIKFLRKQKLGVATFLPLNKVKSDVLDVKVFRKQKGFLGLALDLVDFDSKFRNAFAHVFGSTIVVDNVDSAQKIGIGKCRMVTLDGDLCERSGAMIGGFRSKRGSSFREKDVLRSLEKTRIEIADIESGISRLEKVRAGNESKILRLREFKANLEGEIIKQEKSLHIDSEDLESTRQYKEELVKKVKQLDVELRDLDASVHERISELSQLKSDKEKLRARISEIRKPSVLAELNAFEEKKKQLEQDKFKLDAEISNIDVQLRDVLERDKVNVSKLLQDLDSEEKAFVSEIKTLQDAVSSLNSDLLKKQKEQEKFFSLYKGLFEKRNKLNKEINSKESEILSFEEKARKEELAVNSCSIEIARLKAEIATLRAEFEKYEGVELVSGLSEDVLKSKIVSCERSMASIGNVNLRALEIYVAAEKEYKALLDKRSALLRERDDVVNLMNEIEANKAELFVSALDVVNSHFKQIFSKLSPKGDAYLDLENRDSPFEGGLNIRVRIVGDKFMDLRSLSGGEKTLTALAFLFAIQEHEPATFYVLDEVDAALDKVNSEKLAKLIREYCKRAQYIIISHNDSVIAEGDRLYGVSMEQGSGLSKVVSLKV